MARRPEKVNFQLSVYPEEKEMIKADAKALGMPVARYVVMVCKIVNESTRETAVEVMAGKYTKAMMKGVREALEQG